MLIERKKSKQPADKTAEIEITVMHAICLCAPQNIELCGVELWSSERTNLNCIVLYGSFGSFGEKECNRRKIKNIIFFSVAVIVIFHEEGFEIPVNKTEQAMYL